VTWEREMSNRKFERQSKIAGEGMLAAKSAGLRYVDGRRRGFCGGRRGNGLSYVNVNGKPLRDGETLTRIRSLAIPPDWRWRDSLSDFRQLVFAKRFLEL